jgi:GNAT superfamily N-acetyltransferase
MKAPRFVTAELLDELAPEDPRARRSRRDLQRIHRAMRSVSVLRQGIARLGLAAAPHRIIELGAGDGTLLLRLVRAIHPLWVGSEITLLDRHDLVAAGTLAAYRRLGCSITRLQTDALEWAQTPGAERYQLGVATLFLHHFDDNQLRRLLAALARRTDAFVACEPRRDGLARLASRLVGLLGANAVTRADAVKSVAAGFTGRELSSGWPDGCADWRLDEGYAWPFTHCFVATRLGLDAAESRRVA